MNEADDMLFGEYCLLDVGFLSICCEYVSLLLANKEALLAYGRAE